MSKEKTGQASPKVEDAMTPEIIIVDENASAKDAAGIMDLNEIS
jgi:CBS domain-containing protein